MTWQLVLAGALVGFVIGLTGMGGGALLTPILVLFLGVDPLVAVSSDLVASLVVKPVGAAVHRHRGTVHWQLVRLLCLGSVPAAFGSVVALRLLADPEEVGRITQVGLGVVLLCAVVAAVARDVLDRRGGAATHLVTPRPVPTVLIGVVGGIAVGLTSAGSGTLVIVCLLLCYPALSPRTLVGTDLAQAIPLVGAAAVAHLLFGDVQFALTGQLLVGALPGVVVGALVSARAVTALLKPVLALVLTFSAVKLLGAPTLVAFLASGATVLISLAAETSRRTSTLSRG
jgi:uncharacterized protein